MRRALLFMAIVTFVSALSARAGPAQANPLTGIAAITAGENHTCALTTSGGVKCWGNNQFGQLGAESEETCGEREDPFACSITPVDVTGLGSGVTSIAAGARHTCAVTESGGAKCWGYGKDGRLGDGTTGMGQEAVRRTPVDVVGLTTGVAAVAAGEAHTCALTTAGGVKCWGYNGAGQLGDGATTDRLAPVDVSGLVGGVVAITAGGGFTCALMTAGGAKCWGGNTRAELGTMTTETCGEGDDPVPFCSTTPIDVSGLSSGVTGISAGMDHACAVMAAGGVKCWGFGLSGRLGNGTIEEELHWTPVDVVDLDSGVAAVAAGREHTCALVATGGVKCWGANYAGQLGAPATFLGYPSSPVPVDVIGLTSDALAIAAGWYHNCAVTETGGAKCWGGNGAGGLGDGTQRDSVPPVDVVFSSKISTGDADCAGTVISIDAALILQFDAGLLYRLSCPNAADANQDERVNSIDAALILQYVAGLIVSLPP